MASNCILPPTLENRFSPCKKSICRDPKSDLLRINKQVRQPSSLHTMILSTNCGTLQKDPKFFSYNRLYARRRGCAIKL